MRSGRLSGECVDALHENRRQPGHQELSSRTRGDFGGACAQPSRVGVVHHDSLLSRSRLVPRLTTVRETMRSGQRIYVPAALVGGLAGSGLSAAENHACGCDQTKDADDERVLRECVHQEPSSK